MTDVLKTLAYKSDRTRGRRVILISCKQ